MTDNILTVASNEEAEECQMVVCPRVGKKLLYPDNLTAPCSQCGHTVEFRPNGPKKPPRVCLECALPQMKAEHQSGKLNVLITEKTAQDVMDHLVRKTKH